MEPAAVIGEDFVLYWYPMLLALAAGTGVCFFMAACLWQGISGLRSAAAACLAVGLSLVLARLAYWYGRPDRFSSLAQALTAPGTETFALMGAFGGCLLAAVWTAGGRLGQMLDSMALAGCAAIALGRLGGFFTSGNRGPILPGVTRLPWVYPVVSPANGAPEYRLAIFLFQAMVAAVLGLGLLRLFFRRHRPGEVTAVFLLVYCSSQFLLDSLRYDSIYLRSNGFVSLIQLLAAAGICAGVVYFAAQGPKDLPGKRWLALGALPLLAGAGYLEYYVQRHGRQALAAYIAMGLCLAGLVGLGFLLRHLAASGKTKSPGWE